MLSAGWQPGGVFFSSPLNWRLHLVALIKKSTQEEVRHQSLELLLKTNSHQKKRKDRCLTAFHVSQARVCWSVSPWTQEASHWRKEGNRTHPCSSRDALVGALEGTMSRSWWKKRASRHLISSSVSEGASVRAARWLGGALLFLRVWYSAALEGDCLLSCLLNGIIRAGGCGSGLAGNNNPGPGATAPPSGQKK